MENGTGLKLTARPIRVPRCRFSQSANKINHVAVQSARVDMFQDLLEHSINAYQDRAHYSRSIRITEFL
jgi:hypothetical protein